jgi:hypothetical protein
MIESLAHSHRAIRRPLQSAYGNPRAALDPIDEHFEIASSGPVATCKSGLSYGKVAQIETFDCASSQKEKKIW